MLRRLLRASTTRLRRVDVIVIKIRHNVIVLNDVVLVFGASVLGDSFCCVVIATEWCYDVLFELFCFLLVI